MTIIKRQWKPCFWTLLNKIDEHYRFEGDTDPADETIVYAISSGKYKLKGVLVNAFGVYSDSASNELIEKLKVH